MSVSLAKNERVIKEYEYANMSVVGIGKKSATTKKLTVTNKRIIHQESTAGIGTERISTTEMPVKDAKYVNAYYGSKSFGFLLKLGIYVLIFTVGLVYLLLASDTSLEGGMLALVACLGIIGVVAIILYFVIKDRSVIFSIRTDTHITPAMQASSKAESLLTKGIFARLRSADRGLTINVKVKVNQKVAKELVEELGAVILEAQNAEDPAEA